VSKEPGAVHGHRGGCDGTALSLAKSFRGKGDRLRSRARSAGRRECLDHVIVFNETHLRRILASYVTYYHGSRTHLALSKDSPVPRPVEPGGAGTVVAFPQVGGLHHRYQRLAA
jgi:hypothetical protein